MRLECIEHIQKLSQIYRFVAFDISRLRITFDTRNADGGLPQKRLVAVLLHSEYCHFAIRVQTLARSENDAEQNIRHNIDMDRRIENLQIV